MRYRLSYEFQPTPSAAYLVLRLPRDLPGQRVRRLDLSRPPLNQAENGANLACFLASDAPLTFDLDLETQPTFATPPSEAALDAIRELFYDSLSALPEAAGGYDGPVSSGVGVESLLLSRAVVSTAAQRGWKAEVVFGHLLLERAVPHAWVSLETPDWALECDPWMFFKLQAAPDFWLPQGLAPGADAYLGGHEGRRVVWGSGLVSLAQIPCPRPDSNQDAASEIEVHLWPAALILEDESREEAPKSRLDLVEFSPRARLRPLLEAFRLAAFAALLLVALGLVRPGGWAALAYADYAALLALMQAGGWLELWRKETGRRAALETALFHAAFGTVVFGWPTVWPQTLFALYWIYNRVEPYLRYQLERLTDRAGAS